MPRTMIAFRPFKLLKTPLLEVELVDIHILFSCCHCFKAMCKLAIRWDVYSFTLRVLSIHSMMSGRLASLQLTTETNGWCS